MASNTTEGMLHRLARGNHLKTWIASALGGEPVTVAVYATALAQMTAAVAQRFASLEEYNKASLEDLTACLQPKYSLAGSHQWTNEDRQKAGANPTKPLILLNDPSTCTRI